MVLWSHSLLPPIHTTIMRRMKKAMTSNRIKLKTMTVPLIWSTKRSTDIHQSMIVSETQHSGS